VVDVKKRLLGLDAIGTTLQRAEQIPVGASLLAMIVNDNACLPAKRGALESIVGSPPGASSLLQRIMTPVGLDAIGTT